MTAQALQLDPGDADSLLDAINALPGAGVLLDAVRESGADAHLVGGATRDLLLGRRPRELDVVVDGDPAPLLETLGGEQVRHDRFGTATVTLAPGVLIDVARSRAETYPEPGALPQVDWAPLLIDLHRRDVTINAIAVSLRDGAVTAAPLALDDLAAVRLRVLHPASFDDDPTRLWRLVRYEVRLGADWEAVTWQLAVAAVAGGAPATVAPERIAAELRLALCEPDAFGVLAAAARLGLRPRMDLDAERLWRASQIAGQDAPRAEVALAALGSDDPLLARLLDRRREREVLSAALRLRATDAESARGRPGPLPDGVAGTQLAKRFDGLPIAAVAAAPDAGAASRYLREVHRLRLAITGDDVIAAGVEPGPAVGRALAAAREAVLDGRVGVLDHDAQLRVALAAAC